MISVNNETKKIIDYIMHNSEKLNIKISKSENGATIVDCGIETKGGLEAGKLLSEICLGGLGSVNYTQMNFGDFTIPALDIVVDNAPLGCMASQYAGWTISVGKFFALGSGPARALSLVEKKLFEELDYEDDSNVAIIALETAKVPDAEVIEYIAEKCNVKTEKLFVVVAPCASIAGSVQVSARLVETGLHKMHALGFDINSVISGYGLCPISPVAKDDMAGMGKTNDCLLYGGKTWYSVDCEDSEIEEMIKKVPSSTSNDYGKPFIEIFKAVNYDFYKIDSMLFSPAEITINNVRTGKNFHAGFVNVEVLRQSLGV